MRILQVKRTICRQFPNVLVSADSRQPRPLVVILGSEGLRLRRKHSSEVFAVDLRVLWALATGKLRQGDLLEGLGGGKGVGA